MKERNEKKIKEIEQIYMIFFIMEDTNGLYYLMLKEFNLISKESNDIITHYLNLAGFSKFNEFLDFLFGNAKFLINPENIEEIINANNKIEENTLIIKNRILSKGADYVTFNEYINNIKMSANCKLLYEIDNHYIDIDKNHKNKVIEMLEQVEKYTYYDVSKAKNIIEKLHNSNNLTFENDTVADGNVNFINEIQKAVYKRLKFFKGLNFSKEKIMNDIDFQRLVEYTFHMVENNSLPDEIKPIPQLNITNEEIRYTYYLIHKDIFTTRKIKDIFIDFIHEVFKQFHITGCKGTEKTTTKKKFSQKPQYYDSFIL